MAITPINAEPFVNAFLKLDLQNPLSFLEAAYFFIFGKNSFKVPLLQKQIKPHMAHMIEKIFSEVTRALSQNKSQTIFPFPQEPGISTENLGKGLTQSSLPKIYGLFDKILSENVGISFRAKWVEARPVSFQLSWNAANNKKLRDLFSLDPLIDPNDISEQLNAQRKNGKNTDISFEIGGQLFHGHTSLLSKFQKVSSLIEESKHTNLLQNADPETFEALLEYVYTSRTSLKEKSVDFIMELATLAHNLSINDLVTTCHLHLIFALTSENAQKISNHAFFLEDGNLSRACRSLGAKDYCLDGTTFVNLFFEKAGKISVVETWDRPFLTEVHDMNDAKKALLINVARFSEALFKKVTKELSTGKPSKGSDCPTPAVRLNEKIDFSHILDPSRHQRRPPSAPPKFVHLPDDYFQKLFAETLGLKLIKERPYTYYVSWDPLHEKYLRCIFDIPSPKNPSNTAFWMNEQRKKGEGTDLTFEVEGKKFVAHKSIVTRLPYFSAMLEGPFLEQHKEAISLPQISADIFEEFLCYLYTDEITLRGKSADYVMRLAQVADQLGHIELKNICHFRLMFMISEDNLVAVAQHAFHSNDDDLTHACALFVKNKSDVLNSITAASLLQDEFLGIVKIARYALRTKDEELFATCTPFLKKNIDYLNNIPLTSISLDEFSKFLELASRLGSKTFEEQLRRAMEAKNREDLSLLPDDQKGSSLPTKRQKMGPGEDIL